MVRGQRVDYIFGLAGNPVLHRFAYGVADDLKVRRAEAGAEKMRSFAAFDYAAGSWNRERRVVARLEATARGFDARYIVTSLGGDARHLYEDIYCARGQAENLIKLHKGQLASTGPPARARSPPSPPRPRRFGGGTALERGGHDVRGPGAGAAALVRAARIPGTSRDGRGGLAQDRPLRPLLSFDVQLSRRAGRVTE